MKSKVKWAAAAALLCLLGCAPSWQRSAPKARPPAPAETPTSRGSEFHGLPLGLGPGNIRGLVERGVDGWFALYEPLSASVEFAGLAFDRVLYAFQDGAMKQLRFEIETGQRNDELLANLRFLYGRPVAEIRSVQQFIWLSSGHQVTLQLWPRGGARLTIQRSPSARDWRHPAPQNPEGCLNGPYQWDPEAAGRRGGRCRDSHGRYAASRCCNH